jgi:ribose-phosphate pyrophosphokinase
MIDTGKTLALAAMALKDGGAASIYCLISHGLLASTNFALIRSLPIDALVVTNTLPQNGQRADELMDQLVVIDVTPTIAESIRRTHNGESISLLFGEWTNGVGGTGMY